MRHKELPTLTRLINEALADWIVHFDGLFEPQFSARGLATYGFVVRHGRAKMGEGKGALAASSPASADMAASRAASSPRWTAAGAGFGALVHALTWVEQNKRDECALIVRGDAKLVTETVAGRWKLSSPRLLPMRDMARELVARIAAPTTTFETVSCEENAEADRLSREAYHEAKAAHAEWNAGPPAPRL